MILPSDEDIEHRYHKYIDKVRTATGKWRYIYKKNNELRNKVKANRAMKEKIKERIFKNEKEIQDATQRMNLESNPFNGNPNKDKNNSMNAKILTQHMNEYHATMETYQNFVKDAKVKEKEYLNTPLGKVEDKFPWIGNFLDYIDKKLRR